MNNPANSVIAPFRLPPAALSGMPRFLARGLRSVCEKLLAFDPLNAAYARAIAPQSAAPFCERGLRALGVSIDVSARDIAGVPASGSLIVVANHPFGGLDGMILTALLQRVRPDVRLLANYLLAGIPDMHETCFFVDPFGGPDAARRNLSAMKSALRWVKGGGVLGVFPAGEVSHLRLSHRCITDPPWSDSVARLAQAAAAPVLPVHFSGGNSRLFQVLGLIHPRLRTAMLPRELLNKSGKAIQVRIGSLIPAARLTRVAAAAGAMDPVIRDGATRVTEYLRLRTYILAGRSDGRVNASPAAPPRTALAAPPVVEPLPPGDVAAEVAALPASHCLAQTGSLSVHFGAAAQLPRVLREIGRLRETTFRLAGEGTGREIDLDRFDQHYRHLFVWDAATRRIVGAYRLGQTDEILPRFGPSGLYTTTLFTFHPRLLSQLTPALELGRSFVVPEFQRDFAPLMLLWRGIGRFVVMHPRYRLLFGAVSISDEYQSMTRNLLLEFLREHRLERSLAPLIRAKHPPRPQRFRHADAGAASFVADVKDVEELVSEIEAERRGVPVLLRQYLKLNARLLGFNIDPDFGDVLDGLILIDLATVDRPILTRYLGKEGSAEFLAFHAARTLRPAP
ncbi:hypothetical protein RAS1_20550 [Phycisphaerae bacterium RAS1]|nr:hypothetical protein RAS1_20550 [Phycisphaerae bacterium RAS1]